MHTYTYTHMHTHINTYTHIYTRTHTGPEPSTIIDRLKKLSLTNITNITPF